MSDKPRRKPAAASKRAAVPRGPSLASPEDIAIIGMACLFPGAPDLPTYWRNILSKVDAITDPPPEASDTEAIYDPNSTENDRTYCRRGGFIGGLTWFDALQYNVMPVAVQGGEPDQWVALHVARAALADTGYGDQIPDRHRTAVILGRGSYPTRAAATAMQHVFVVDQTIQILRTLHPEYTDTDLATIRQELKRGLPPFNADTAAAYIPNIIVGRIANRLDLMGPSFTVDAACASFTVALDAAVRGLRLREIDMALVGGVHTKTSAPIIALFSQLGALSRRQQIRPFDRHADGTILGEGVGMVVLRRREDAERDGRRIYALIKGSGVSSDGHGLGVLAPRLEGEVAALERAYSNAGVSPLSIGLVEGHGTGTPAGDVVEIKALTRVFGTRTGALPRCAIGSVKSMVGHLMPAAGAAGLIKVALSLYHKVLPPTLNVDEPNPEMDLAKTPFYINREVRPWIHAASDAPRRAAVNAFGFGGINSHVVLEEYPEPSAPTARSHCPPWDAEVLILSGPTRSALADRARQIGRFLRANPDTVLADLAYTLNVPLRGAAARLAIVGSTVEDILPKLDRSMELLGDPTRRQIRDAQGIYFFESPLAGPGRVAFLFPGEGSQYLDMLADLCVHLPEVRKHFDAVDRVLAAQGRQFLLGDLVFPPAAFTDAERRSVEDRLSQMDGAVEAVVTANRALFALLTALGIRPDAIVGHSSGEYSAMLASGMIEVADEHDVAEFARDLHAVYSDAAVGGEIPRAALVAVGAGIETVAACMDGASGDISVAMDNCPHQTVIIGPDDAMTLVLDRLRERGVICERLGFDRPYHTPMFAAFARKLRAFFGRWLSSPGRIPTYSCTTAARFAADVAACRMVAVDHWMQPVQFRKTIETMYANGIRVFVEAGPRGNLTSFVGDILRGRPHLAVAANLASRTGIAQLNHLVAVLAAHGVEMTLDPLYAHRSPQRLDLERPAEEAARGRRATRRTKLLTGWPVMRVSAERPPSPEPRPAPRAEPPARDDRALTPPAESGASPAANGAGQRQTRRGDPLPPVWRPTPVAAHGPRLPSMTAYLKTMEHFLAAQEDVLQAFLGRAVSAGPGAALVEHSPMKSGPEREASGAPSPVAQTAGPVTGQGGAPRPAPTPAAGFSSPSLPAAPSNTEAIDSALLELVSDRTGYPADMLDLEADLEADLGIDSIKRVEILGALQRRMSFIRSEDLEALTGKRSLQQVIAFLTSRREAAIGAPEGAGAPSAPARAPLFGTIVAWRPGEEAIVRRQLTLEEDRLLTDHTMGHRISVADPELRGLSVVPLSLTIEMMAEAGALLAPGQTLLGMREVRAHRWAELAHSRLVVTLLARRDPRVPDEVQVWLHEGESAPPSSAPTLLAEATALFGPSLPEGPPAAPLHLTGETRSSWTPDLLYSRHMFHGPRFRGVVSMDRTGAEGGTATLEVLPRHDLFRSIPDPALLTDPVLLDQPGQVVGFWATEHLDGGYVVFPFRVERLSLYSAPLTPGERLECRARISVVDRNQLRSDLEVVGPDGRVRARLEGWWNRRFHLPLPFFRALSALRDQPFSTPWSTPLAHVDSPSALSCHRLGLDDLPAEFAESQGGFWQRAAAHMVLSPREREVWHGLKTPAPRRTEWLMGRMVAKDAVRQFLRARHGISVCAADVEIWPDEHGRPHASGTWLDQVVRAPMVSLSHSDRFAAAVAGDAQVGLDIERARPIGDAEGLAFTLAERSLLATMGGAAGGPWPLRFWCAKEAVAKALGQGLVGGPQALVVTAFDPGTGIATVGLTGAMAQRFPGVDPICAYTAHADDVIVAVAVRLPDEGS